MEYKEINEIIFILCEKYYIEGEKRVNLNNF